MRSLLLSLAVSLAVSASLACCTGIWLESYPHIDLQLANSSWQLCGYLFGCCSVASSWLPVGGKDLYVRAAPGTIDLLNAQATHAPHALKLSYLIHSTPFLFISLTPCCISLFSWSFHFSLFPPACPSSFTRCFSLAVLVGDS